MNYSSLELFKILNVPYYHGEMTKSEAEELLKMSPPGTFIIRDSSSRYETLETILNVKTPLAISLSLLSGGVIHDRIQLHADSKFTLEEDCHKYESVEELIKYYSSIRKYRLMPTYSLKRNVPFTLQFLCKHIILYNNIYIPFILRKNLL